MQAVFIPSGPEFSRLSGEAIGSVGKQIPPGNICACTLRSRHPLSDCKPSVSLSHPRPVFLRQPWYRFRGISESPRSGGHETFRTAPRRRRARGANAPGSALDRVRQRSGQLLAATAGPATRSRLTRPGSHAGISSPFVSQMCHRRLRGQEGLRRASGGLSRSLPLPRAAWQSEWSSPEPSLLSLGLGSPEVPPATNALPLTRHHGSTPGSRGERGCSGKATAPWHSCPNQGNNSFKRDCVQNDLQNPFPPSLSRSQLRQALGSQETSSPCPSLEEPTGELGF